MKYKTWMFVVDLPLMLSLIKNHSNNFNRDPYKNGMPEKNEDLTF